MQSYAPYYVYIYGDYGTEWNLRSGLLLRREINKSKGYAEGKYSLRGRLISLTSTSLRDT